MFAKSALTAAALIAVIAGSQAADAKPICQINPGLCAKLPILPVKPVNPVKYPLLPLQPVQQTPIKFPVIPLLPPQKPIFTPIKFPIISVLPPQKPIYTPIKFPIFPVVPVLPAPSPVPQPGIDINVNIDGGPGYVPYDPGYGYPHHSVDPGYHHKNPGLTLASVNAGAIGPSAATQQQPPVVTASCMDVQQAVAQAGFTEVALESCGKSDFIYDAKLFGGEYLVDVASNGQLSNVISLTF